MAPVRINFVPVGPLVGEKELIVGEAVDNTSKKVAFPIESCVKTVAVPAGVVITI